ncbi:hypothetical protein IL306_003781 [Fusarium sp. DS 682]|nr:hypothetical protein IL306_003781 [Fusarium sp. DS 682]
METLQKSLEVVCYQYAKEVLPNILRERGWDCPESVELNEWTGILSREGLLGSGMTPKPSKDFLRSIASIRHTAVHRVRTNATGLEKFLTDAEAFARALENNTMQVGVISKLRADLSSVVSELAQNKQFLQLQLERTQLEIEQQRQELIRREQEAKAYMRDEDRRYRELAGEKLQRALAQIQDFGATINAGNTISEEVEGTDSLEGTMEEEGGEDKDEFEDCIEYSDLSHIYLTYK